ncbi:MAG TPA: rhodanese-like domain-containing protein [Candidatus Aquicultoraceae bacterium]|nr:rhodanese-like domain-containing protein [Candidatus Aquicultoraceae bacterium]
MALRLRELGFARVYALEGGWNEWVSAGYPTERVPR